MGERIIMSIDSKGQTSTSDTLDRDWKSKQGITPLDKYNNGGIINGTQPATPGKESSGPIPSSELIDTQPTKTDVFGFFKRFLERPESTPDPQIVVTETTDNPGETTMLGPAKGLSKEDKAADRQAARYDPGDTLQVSSDVAPGETQERLAEKVDKADKPLSRRLFLAGAAGVATGVALKSWADQISQAPAIPKVFPPKPAEVITPIQETPKGPQYFGSLFSGTYADGNYVGVEHINEQPIEALTKFFLIKDRSSEELQQYETYLQDPTFVRMLGRIHEVINGVDFAQMTTSPMTINRLEEGQLYLLQKAWDNPDKFARLANLFAPFKQPLENVEKRKESEKHAGTTLWWLLQQINEHPETAQPRGDIIYNTFDSPETGIPELWNHPSAPSNR